MSDPNSVAYEEIEHTADLALRVYGKTLEALFLNAAKGMFHLLSDDRHQPPSAQHTIELDSPDTETLLVDWLNELLYLVDAYGETYDHFEIMELQPTSLKARVSGGKARHIKKEIKAATFHNLSIDRTDSGYMVTIVFDV